MQNDSPVIDFSRPVLWWYSVDISLRGGGGHKTFVRAKTLSAARVMADEIKSGLPVKTNGTVPLVCGARIAGCLVVRGVSFAGYADE